MAKEKSPGVHTSQKPTRFSKFVHQQNGGLVGLSLVPLIAKFHRPKGRIIHRFQLNPINIKPIRSSSKSRPRSREHSHSKDRSKKHHRHGKSHSRHRKKSQLGFIVKEIPSLESLSASVSTRNPSLLAIAEDDNAPPESGDAFLPSTQTIPFYNPTVVTEIDIDAIIAKYEGVYPPKAQSTCAEDVEDHTYYNRSGTPVSISSRDFDENGSPVTRTTKIGSNYSHKSKRTRTSSSHCSEDAEINSSPRSKRRHKTRSSLRSRRPVTPLSNVSDDIEDNSSSVSGSSRKHASYRSRRGHRSVVNCSGDLVDNSTTALRPESPASLNSDEAASCISPLKKPPMLCLDVDPATPVETCLALVLVKDKTQSPLSCNRVEVHESLCNNQTKILDVCKESQYCSPDSEGVLAVTAGETVEEKGLALVLYNPLDVAIVSSNDTGEEAVSVTSSNDTAERAVSVTSSNEGPEEVVSITSSNDGLHKAVSANNSNKHLSQIDESVANRDDGSQKLSSVNSSNDDVSSDGESVAKSNDVTSQKDMKVIRSAIALRDSVSETSVREGTYDTFDDSSYITEECSSRIGTSLSSSDTEDSVTEIYEPPPKVVEKTQSCVSDAEASEKPESLDSKSSQQETKLPAITEKESKESGINEEKVEAGARIKEAWRITYNHWANTHRLETQTKDDDTQNEPESRVSVSASSYLSRASAASSKQSLRQHRSLMNQASGARIKETLRVFMENKDRSKKLKEARLRRHTNS